MTKENVTELLGLIRIAYPRFYANLTKQDALATIELWYSMFKDMEYEVVKVAVNSLINTLEFPPTIADVKNEIYKLSTVDENNALDEWNAIKGAIRNGIYYAGEMFERLPPIAKKFCGSPNQIKEWAMTPDLNDGVLRGQFLKQYDVIQKREKFKALMTPEVKEFIQKLTDQKDLKRLESGK